MGWSSYVEITICLMGHHQLRITPLRNTNRHLVPLGVVITSAALTPAHFLEVPDALPSSHHFSSNEVYQCAAALEEGAVRLCPSATTIQLPLGSFEGTNSPPSKLQSLQCKA